MCVCVCVVGVGREGGGGGGVRDGTEGNTLVCDGLYVPLLQILHLLELVRAVAVVCEPECAETADPREKRSHMHEVGLRNVWMDERAFARMSVYVSLRSPLFMGRQSSRKPCGHARKYAIMDVCASHAHVRVCICARVHARAKRIGAHFVRETCVPKDQRRVLGGDTLHSCLFIPLALSSEATS